MENLRPNEQRARNAMIFVLLVVLTEIAATVSNYWQLDLLQTVASGGTISEEEATANDLREAMIGVIGFVIYIAFLIIFIQWFRRAYFNLHQKIDGLSFSDGWAAGSWFVPILNLIRPFQIMRELYQKTQELLRKNGKDFNYSIPLLYTWWGVFTITSVISNVLLRNTLKADDAATLEILIKQTSISLFANALSIPAFLLTFFVIRNYARIEPLIPETTTSKKDEDLSMHLISTDTKSK